MGARGPLPKAKTRRRNKKRPAAGLVPVFRPSKPKHLTGEASSEWNRIVPVLMQAGYLTKLDRGALIRYCQAWKEWVDLVKILGQSGSLIRGTKDQLVRNPLWLVRNDLEKTLSDLGAKLGLAPGPRRRMDVEHEALPTKDDGEPDERAAYKARLQAARAADGETK